MAASRPRAKPGPRLGAIRSIRLTLEQELEIDRLRGDRQSLTGYVRDLIEDALAKRDEPTEQDMAEVERIMARRGVTLEMLIERKK